ncbi:MAG TPA: nitroreductase family protein [Bacillota bacterium]|nr:nitroreductase family protein [Bacillota bacterium]
MNKSDEEEKNKVLDEIILKRRSIRKFKNETPPKELIEAIINAGIWAPYTGIAGVSVTEIRKFFILCKDSEKMLTAEKIITSQLKSNAKKLSLAVKFVPFIRKNGKAFVQNINNMAKNGVPAFKTAPYYVIIAEHKGMPPAQKQSLAHVLQNMWLKATALGLGFQLLTLTETMSQNKDFLNLLGLPYGEYELDGCAIGYPDQTPIEKKIPTVNEVTKWF